MCRLVVQSIDIGRLAAWVLDLSAALAAARRSCATDGGPIALTGYLPRASEIAEYSDKLNQCYATTAERGLCYGMTDMPSASMRGLARRCAGVPCPDQRHPRAVVWSQGRMSPIEPHEIPPEKPRKPARRSAK